MLRVAGVVGQLAGADRGRRRGRGRAVRPTRRGARRPTSGRRRCGTQGVTGQGVRIAILDTGIDADPPRPRRPGLPALVDACSARPRSWTQRNFIGGPLRARSSAPATATATARTSPASPPGPARARRSPTTTAGTPGSRPDAELAVGKVLTDAGAGLNSDLIAAMEWAAMPGRARSAAAIGAHDREHEPGSESRPDAPELGQRRRPGQRRAQPPGGAATGRCSWPRRQQRAVHRQPAGGAGRRLAGAERRRRRPRTGTSTTTTRSPATTAPATSTRRRQLADNDCAPAPGTQPPSLSSFSSRGPSGDLWLRPDIAAPGYNIVSAQASTGHGARAERHQPEHAERPAVRHRQRHVDGRAGGRGQRGAPARGVPGRGTARCPSGAIGRAPALTAPAYALVRAALMNTAGSDLLRGALDRSRPTLAAIPTARRVQDPFALRLRAHRRSRGRARLARVYEVRNGAADPYVGPAGRGRRQGRIGPASRRCATGS